jgi:hypothetical protein
VAVRKYLPGLIFDTPMDTLHAFDRNGQLLYDIGDSGPHKLGTIMGLAVNRHGQVLVIEDSKPRVTIFACGGDFVACEFAAVASPVCVSVDPDNVVYLVNRRQSFHSVLHAFALDLQ